MKSLNPEERFYLLCEMGEWMYNPLSEKMEDVLMVPNFVEKEVAFYLNNPYPDCLEIPAIMKQRFSYDYKSIVTSSLKEFKKYR